MSDNVNHPEHYLFPNGAEVIDITEHLSFNLGNVVKYVARAGRKAASSQEEDLRKSLFYLKRELKRLGISLDEPDPVQRTAWTLESVQEELSKLWDYRAPIVTTWREWSDLTKVPPGVIVADREGDHYRRVQGTNEFQLSYQDCECDDQQWVPVPTWLMRDQTGYAPFREVKDG